MASWNLGGLLGDPVGGNPVPEEEVEFIAAKIQKDPKALRREQALTNKVHVNRADSPKLGKAIIVTFRNKSCTYLVAVDQGEYKYVKPGTIAFSDAQRKSLKNLIEGDTVVCKPLNLKRDVPPAAVVNFSVGLRTKSKGEQDTTTAEHLAEHCRKVLTGHVLSFSQSYIVEYMPARSLKPLTLVLEVTAPAEVSQLVASTEFLFTVKSEDDSRLKIKGGNTRGVFKTDFDFKKMGIGGLDKEFEQIFRRAFASRVFPPETVQQLGIKHVKGMLLYGPPGTGKTLIARQIGKMLNENEPKIVNGPEILNKFVGQSEENIRELFKDAVQDQQANGEDSDLHIIIFDEIDAICKQRGTSGGSTGVGDTVVNQLLSMIDGVNALNNILVIGMTNRKDMIDDALLRPGRLEVHVEISLPDEYGRQQILKIHTSKMTESKLLDASVDIPKLAASTKNYSGAELEGVCKSAAAFALNRHVDINDLKKKIDTSGLKVTMSDFEHALTEVQPAFGMGKETFARCLLGGFLNYGPRCQQLVEAGELFRDEVERSSRSPLVTILVEGAPGTGKTALAAFLATQSGFPFVRLISPETYVGYSEPAKCAAIAKAFDDAHKSPLSVVMIDDIERLIEYSPIGPRFSNIVLQTLMILCKQTPPSGRRLLILATTSSSRVLEQLDFKRSFSAFLETDALTEAEISTILSGAAEPYDVSGAFATTSANGLAPGSLRFKFKSSADRETTLALLSAENLGIKKLLMVLFMSQEEASEGVHYIDVDRLTKVLRDIV